MWFPRCISSFAFCLCPVVTAVAQSNFDLEHSVLSVDSIGALEWAFPQNGVAINQYYASGYIYGANIGWVSLGSTPVDKLRYRNNTANDFGINVSADGALRGFAYGANVGWINFEPIGNPRLDWISGKLAGRVWSANLGWLDLETPTEFLRIDSLPEPADSDSDAIADSWEMFHASNLASFSAASDADADGLSDLNEYLAGTDPLDPADSLLVQVRVANPQGGSALQWPTKAGYLYFIDQRSALGASANWSTASEKIVGSGAPASVTVPFSTNYSFFRVRAYPPLSAP